MQKQTLSLTPGVLATVQKAKLRYCDRFQMDAGTGGVTAVRVYSSNGCYDPDITGVGHQPRGFDQIMQLYDHYVVTYCTLKVYVDNNAEASGMYVGAALRDGAVTSVDFRDYMEYGLKKGVLLGHNGGAPTAASFTFGIDPNKFLGRKDPFSDPQLKGSISANPAETADFHIFAYPLNSGDAQPVNVMIEMEFDVSFIEPKTPTIS